MSLLLLLSYVTVVTKNRFLSFCYAFPIIANLEAMGLYNFLIQVHIFRVSDSFLFPPPP